MRNRLLKPLQLTRNITVRQSPVGGSSQVVNTIKDDGVKDVERLKSARPLNEAEFRVLGHPPSILSINAPPSIPIYLRKGSLLSLFGIEGNDVKNIKTSVELVNVLKSIVYGGYANTYQKVISTVPFSLLVSSKARSWLSNGSEQKSLAVLALDGTHDWAILEKSALQVYSGGSLNVTLHKRPRFVSKRLANSLKIPRNSHTGLFKWNHLGYNLLSGRGLVGLSGHGSIYSITINEDEDLLINRENLLAVSVNGTYDLLNSVVKYISPVNRANEISGEEIISTAITNRLSSNAKVRYYFNIVRPYWSKISNFFRSYRRKSLNFLVGNQDFIRIVGPRHILLQSNTSTLNSGQISNLQSSFSVMTKKVPELKSTDFLNYVTIDPQKGATFKSTPNFQETVLKIARK